MPDLPDAVAVLLASTEDDTPCCNAECKIDSSGQEPACHKFRRLPLVSLVYIAAALEMREPLGKHRTQ